MDDFYILTNIGITINDLKNNILIFNGWQDICTKFHRANKDALKNCIESDNCLAQNLKPGVYSMHKCKNNMRDVVTPIIIGNKHIGNLFFGQFFFDDEVVDRKIFSDQADKFGFDKKEYLAALDRVPRWSRDKIKILMDFYLKFAQMISNLGFSNLKLAKTLNDYRLAEEVLHESEEKYRTLVEKVKESIFIVQGGIFVFANHRAHELMGLLEGDFIGKPFIDFIWPEDRKMVFANYMKQIAGEIIDDIYDFRMISVEGGAIWVFMSVALIQYKGKPATLIMVTNITDRKKAEEKLKNAQLLLKSGIESPKGMIILAIDNKIVTCFLTKFIKML